MGLALPKPRQTPTKTPFIRVFLHSTPRSFLSKPLPKPRLRRSAVAMCCAYRRTAILRACAYRRTAILRACAYRRTAVLRACAYRRTTDLVACARWLTLPKPRICPISWGISLPKPRPGAFFLKASESYPYQNPVRIGAQVLLKSLPANTESSPCRRS